MFNKIINSITLTSEVADRLFSNVTDMGTPDQSFLATLRALLRTRLQQNEEVRLYNRTFHITIETIASMTPSRFMDLFSIETSRNVLWTGYSISIISTTNADTGAAMLDKIRANAGNGKRYMSDYTRHDDLQVFFGKRVNALFYRHTNERNIIIFVDKLELKHFHALQMMIPKYLPSLFADNPLSEKETELLKSTGNKSAGVYEMLIEDFAKHLDLRVEIIRSKLAGFETAYESTRIDELKKEISRHENDYGSYLSSLQELTEKIQNCKYTLAGLECAIKEHSGDSELMEYFMCNKNLSIVNVSGATIEFIAHGYADIYDEDAFERYVANHNGYMYSNLNSSVTKPQMELLYRAIFGSQKYKLRMCAAYIAGVVSGLSAKRGFLYPLESQTYLPNPHIQFHGCIGGYSARFLEYMKKRDYVGAIDQACVSGRNLNFYDSAAISTLARELSGSKLSCIEKQDGSLLTPMEAIRELEGGAVCQDQ